MSEMSRGRNKIEHEMRAGQSLQAAAKSMVRRTAPKYRSWAVRGRGRAPPGDEHPEMPSNVVWVGWALCGGGERAAKSKKWP